MNILGIECDKSSFSFVVLGFNASAFTLVTSASRSSPPNSRRSVVLDWVYEETRSVCQEFSPTFAVLKKAESGARTSKAILEHAEVDGAVQAAIGSLGIESEAIVWKTLSSRLGLSNKDSALAHLKSLPDFKTVARSRMAPLGAALSVDLN